METRFTEGWRAAHYVARGIARDYAAEGVHCDGMLEVTLHKRGAVLRKFCLLEQMEGVLRSLCAEFPRAVVQYHPDSAYGFVAQILCQCGRAGSEGCCRCNGQDRATVTVVMSREKEEAAASEHALGRVTGGRT